MFDGLRFRYKVWNVRREQARRLNAIDWNKTSRAEAPDSRIWEEAQDHIDLIHTHYLLSQLDKLRLPRPKFTDDNWVGSKWINHEFLSTTAIVEVRDAIRKERKERSEITRLWLGSIVPIVSALAGLLGVVIGLVAILKK